MIYLVYDPNKNNEIVRWVQCTPETIRWQPLRNQELIVWHDGPPPQLGSVPKYYNPDTREIIDGDTPPVG